MGFAENYRCFCAGFSPNTETIYVKIVLTNKRFHFIHFKSVNKTHPDSLIDNNYVDTSIAVLLFSQGNVDTLSATHIHSLEYNIIVRFYI